MSLWQEASHSLHVTLGTRSGHFCPGHKDNTAKMNQGLGLEGFQTERGAGGRGWLALQITKQIRVLLWCELEISMQILLAGFFIFNLN